MRVQWLKYSYCRRSVRNECLLRECTAVNPTNALGSGDKHYEPDRESDGVAGGVVHMASKIFENPIDTTKAANNPFTTRTQNGLSVVIPTALKIDLCPLACGD